MFLLLYQSDCLFFYPISFLQLDPMTDLGTVLTEAKLNYCLLNNSLLVCNVLGSVGMHSFTGSQ